MFKDFLLLSFYPSGLPVHGMALPHSRAHLPSLGYSFLGIISQTRPQEAINDVLGACQSGLTIPMISKLLSLSWLVAFTSVFSTRLKSSQMQAE